MEQAIKKAIEGGYGDYAYCNEFDMYESSSSYCHSTVQLDPPFWQALGRVQGWNGLGNKAWQIHYANGMLFGWQAVWHNFIDHIIEGESAESFFNELLA